MNEREGLSYPERVNPELYEKTSLRDKAYPYVVGVSLVIATVLFIVSIVIKEVN